MATGFIEFDNLALPISNAENKQLENEVHAKQLEIERLSREIEENQDRISVITDHLKNVQQELQLSQALYEARKNDVQTEKHMMQLAEREEGRLKNDLNKFKQEQEELKERMNSYENNVYSTNKKSEDLRQKMNWDQEALEAWLEESARRDEDVLTITKYAKADEEKIKEMSLKQERLNELVIRKKHMLDMETTETLTAQIELDKTADAFRNAHGERQLLIAQWEKIIDQMRRRDLDMDRTGTELARLKAEIRALEDALRDKKDFLEQEKNNNQELEKQINLSERQVAKCRLDYQDRETAKFQLRDELETMKYSVDRTAADLEKMRSQNRHLTREAKDKTLRLDTVKHQRQLMQQELKKTTLKTLSAEEKAHKLDQLLAEEEARVAAIEKEISSAQEKQFKKAQELKEAKRSQQNIEAEIQGGRVALRNLHSKQHKVDEEALKQQELLYMQDLQLQQLEHKYNRMEGERTDDELIALNAKIQLLEGQWQEQQQTELVLQGQLKTLQDDLRRVMRQVEQGLKDRDTLIGKIDELNLYIDSTQRELKKVTTSKQDLMVDENILKLELKRLRDSLFSHSDQVLGLEKQKLQLHTAMTERNKEINVHKEMLRARIKSCETERQTISSELHNRIAKIDRLRKRYEILMMSMAPPEGEEEHSQTYYVIKAAQEREELQREGDEYDAKIRKAEREINALENTLALMNSKNTKFRQTLQRVDPSGNEVLELESLEGQLRATLDKQRHKKKQTKQLTTEIQVIHLRTRLLWASNKVMRLISAIATESESLMNTLSTLDREEESLQYSLDNKKNELSMAEKDLHDMQGKMDRATNQCMRLLKEIRAKQTSGVMKKATNIEDDIELRNLRDFNANLLQQICGIATQDPQLSSTLQLLLSQVGLPPPPSPSGSRASSLPSSARSSVTSLSTSRTASQHGSTTSRQTTPLQTTTLDLGDIGSPQKGVTSCTSSSSSVGSSTSKQKQRTPTRSKASSAASSSSKFDVTIKPA